MKTLLFIWILVGMAFATVTVGPSNCLHIVNDGSSLIQLTNARLAGADFNATAQTGNSGMACIFIENQSNLVFQCVNATLTNNVTNPTTGILVYNSNNVTVKDCNVT